MVQAAAEVQMKRGAKALALIVAIAAGSSGTSRMTQPQFYGDSPWWGCCGATPWLQGRGGVMGPDGGLMSARAARAGMARNEAAMAGRVPAAYAGFYNPLPKTAATIARGAKVYARNCVSCHGNTGLGDGPGGLALSPRPANLAWLSRMPIIRWDPFMYWTVAEGGAAFHTAMPAFRDRLSREDRWAAIAYIQARLPRSKAR
jgi:mono/diheme cytochrome c family protein